MKYLRTVRAHGTYHLASFISLPHSALYPWPLKEWICILQHSTLKHCYHPVGTVIVRALKHMHICTRINCKRVEKCEKNTNKLTSLPPWQISIDSNTMFNFGGRPNERRWPRPYIVYKQTRCLWVGPGDFSWVIGSLPRPSSVTHASFRCGYKIYLDIS